MNEESHGSLSTGELSRLTAKERRALVEQTRAELIEEIVARHTSEFHKPDRVPGDMDWTGYMPYVSVHGVPFRELTRRQAQMEFEALMAARGERKAELTGLPQSNGVVAGDDETGLDGLDEWLSIMCNPLTRTLIGWETYGTPSRWIRVCF